MTKKSIANMGYHVAAVGIASRHPYIFTEELIGLIRTASRTAN